MSITDTQDWNVKVNKLLAKAERASTPEEAEAFFTKAQDIITRKGIDEAMLAAAGNGEPDDEIIVDEVEIKKSGYFRMTAQMWVEVADSNTVRALVRNPQSFPSNPGMTLIGFRSDVERVKMLVTSLMIQMVRESRQSMPEAYRFAGATKMAQWRRSFRMAYAVRIGQRLREQIRLTQAEVAKETGNRDFLPAVVDRQSKVDAMADGMAGKARKTRLKFDHNGYQSGHEAANRSDLGNTRVGNTRKEIG